MKSLFVNFGRILLATVVLLVAACLPVIPVLESAVVPDPSSRLVWRCVLQFAVSPFVMGIRLQPTLMTLPILVALSVVLRIGIRFVNRRVFDRSVNKPLIHNAE